MSGRDRRAIRILLSGRLARRRTRRPRPGGLSSHPPPGDGLMQNTEEIWRLVDAKKDRLRGAERPRLGHAGTLLRRIPLLRRAHGDAGAAGLPRHQERRRHPDRGDGRGGRRRAGDRHPRRIRRAARAEPGGRRGRTEAAAGRRLRPWLRAQPARLGVDAGGDRGEGLPRRARHQGPRALLWLPGRRRRRGEGLHGARRRVQRRRCRDLLASGGVLRRERGDLARQHAHRFHASTAAPRMPPRRRISAAARSMRSS